MKTIVLASLVARLLLFTSVVYAEEELQKDQSVTRSIPMGPNPYAEFFFRLPKGKDFKVYANTIGGFVEVLSLYSIAQHVNTILDHKNRVITRLESLQLKVRTMAFSSWVVLGQLSV